MEYEAPPGPLGTLAFADIVIMFNILVSGHRSAVVPVGWQALVR